MSDTGRLVPPSVFAEVCWAVYVGLLLFAYHLEKVSSKKYNYIFLRKNTRSSEDVRVPC